MAKEKRTAADVAAGIEAQELEAADQPLREQTKAAPVAEQEAPAAEKEPEKRYTADEVAEIAKQAAAEETPALPELNLKTNDLGLTDDQMAILRALKAGALQVDDLIEKTQIPTRRVLSALTMMELEGYVEQGSGKHFSLTVTLLEE